MVVCASGSIIAKGNKVQAKETKNFAKPVLILEQVKDLDKSRFIFSNSKPQPDNTSWGFCL